MAPCLHSLLATGLVEQAKRRETDGKVLLADGLGQSVHQLKDEPAPFLRRTAVLVRALVHVGAQELLREVAVSAMDLDTVESNLHRGLSRVAIVLDRALDVVVRQFDGRVLRVENLLVVSHGRVGVDLAGVVPGGGRGGNRRGSRHLRDRGASSVPDLAIYIPSFRVHGVDDLLPRGDLLWDKHAWDSGHAIALLLLVR